MGSHHPLGFFFVFGAGGRALKFGFRRTPIPLERRSWEGVMRIPAWRPLDSFGMFPLFWPRQPVTNKSDWNVFWLRRCLLPGLPLFVLLLPADMIASSSVKYVAGRVSHHFSSFCGRLVFCGNFITTNEPHLNADGRRMSEDGHFLSVCAVYIIPRMCQREVMRSC